MKKTTLKKFRNIYANITLLIFLCFFTVITFWSTASYASTANSDAPLYHGNKNSNNISLMLNVYWGTEYIKPMLDVFDTYNVKTTFFVGGSWAVKESETLKLIFDKGHEIGNHGFFHKNHDKLSQERNYEEIFKCHEVVDGILSYKMSLFAPPSGAFNKATLKVAKQLNYQTIMWSKDTIDWRDKDTSLIISRATKNLSGGDFVLMHPTQNTLDALPHILESIKSKGLTATTVSNTILV